MEPMLDTYNENSILQASCQTIGNPLVATMAAHYAEQLAPAQPSCVRIVDYGCSGGRNSHDPLRTMIEALRSRFPQIRAECVLQDLPANNWDQVMLHEAPRLMATLAGRAHVLCSGTSFYNQVFADQSVDLGYSYVAAHFLSDTRPLPSHVLMHEASGDERAAWTAQAARDWEQFLLCRARELKRGGRLMISTMSRDASGYSWQQFSHLVWESIQNARARGSLTRREADALCIPAALRSEAEILAPFLSRSAVAHQLEPTRLEFARTEVDGERNLPAAFLAPRIRLRIESVWGGMFLRQLVRLDRRRIEAQAVLREVWDSFEELLLKDTSRGWLDMRSFYLEVTRM
jgi:hypothetical protein